MFFRKHKNRLSLSIEDESLTKIAKKIGDGEKKEKIELLLKRIQGLGLEDI